MALLYYESGMTIATTVTTETIVCPLTRREQDETRDCWQPQLNGSLLRLRPLATSDFDALFAAASDPLIWELHPDRERFKRERFEIYFQSGLDSNGALVIVAQDTGKIIGSSRFTGHHPATESIEVGYTFLTREYWGGVYNRELKRLMLDHAFGFVDRVYFVAGRSNFRSQRALTKIGATAITDATETPISADRRDSVVYFIDKTNRSPL